MSPAQRSPSGGPGRGPRDSNRRGGPPGPNRGGSQGPPRNARTERGASRDLGKARGPGFEADLDQGQVWTYATRPGEEDSRVTIGKLERLKDGTGVVHVRIDGLELKNSMAPGGITQEVVHAPVHEYAFRESIREQEGQAKRLPNFDEGLLDWKRAFGVGDADIFNIPIAEIVDWLEESFRRGH